MLDRRSASAPPPRRALGPASDRAPTESTEADDTDEIRPGDVAEGSGEHDPFALRTELDRALADDEVVSGTLPVGADVAYAAFCDLDASPLWVSVVRSCRIIDRDEAGRPRRAAYLARLQNATIGYTLGYHYDPARRAVTWSTAPGSATIVRGRAEFSPLGDRACLVQYQLTLELPPDALPDWEDPFFSGHAASVVMNDFRDYVTRIGKH